MMIMTTSASRRSLYMLLEESVCALVRDSFQSRKQKSDGERGERGRRATARTKWKLLCLFTPLYPKAVPSVYTHSASSKLRRSKEKNLMFRRMLDIMSPDAFSILLHRHKYTRARGLRSRLTFLFCVHFPSGKLNYDDSRWRVGE